MLLLQGGAALVQDIFSNGRIYTCRYSSIIPVIDGSGDEAIWAGAKWSEYFIDIKGTSGPAPHLKTRFKMLWDDRCLYIYAEMEEPHIWAKLKQRDTIVYHDNDFEVFIDIEGNAADYYEIEVNAYGTILDLFLEKPYRSGGRPDLSWDCQGIEVAVATKGTLNNPADKDTCWMVEMALPWMAFSNHSDNLQKPHDGTTWRMNFSRVLWKTDPSTGYSKTRNPDTGKVLPEDNWVWAPQGEINMHIPEKWGTVVFKKEQPRYWTWIGGNGNRSLNGWDSIFSEMSRLGIGGALINADSAMLSRIVPLAGKHRIQVHAWFWTMNRWDADTSWLSVNRLGNSLARQKAYVDYYRFMCPALPEVKAFLAKKISSLASVPGLEGIHMDYIRYVDAILPTGLQPKYGLAQDSVFPEFDYGYHPYMRKLYLDKTGIDPLYTKDAGSDSAWLYFRLNALNETVAGIRDCIRQQKLDVSAAVFPTPAMSVDMVRQQWDKWELDYYFPMVYHNFYNQDIGWIEEVMKKTGR